MRWRRRRPPRAVVAAQAADRARIAEGGIPASAERRLRTLGERGAFTSDLSVAEFALLRDAALEPVAQVTGSSVYQIGWGTSTLSWMQPVELLAVTKAYAAVRTLAIGRLRAEAELAGADGVVAVRVGTSGFDWSAGLIEVALVGTAVRGPGLRAGGGPALTTLSGQDCTLLLRHGHRPCGIVAGTGVFTGGLTAPGQLSMSGPLPLRLNYEYEGATRTWSAARHAALARLRAQAEALRATGVVGTRWQQQERVVEGQRSVTYTIHVLGTAIAVGHGPAPPAATTLSLTPKEASTR
jgi:uncharacterized protein YbjQ (UPF0145 family)